jgi:lysophospholipase L1-like esterase
MSETAQNAGKLVILCTVTPVVGRSYPERVVAYNQAIRSGAPLLSIPVADFEAAFGSNPLQYLSPDRLHPSDAGYQLMAQVLYELIVSRFEGGR